MSRVFSAKVKGGAIVADGIDLPDGTVVTVIVEGTAEDDYDTLTADEEAELAEAIAEADRGEGVPWETVRAELQRRS